jgi:hypothetical protein
METSTEYIGLLDLPKEKPQEMTESETGLLVSAFLREQDGGIGYEELKKALENFLPGKILTKRMEHHLGGPASLAAAPEALLMATGTSTNDRPGTAVMWAYTLIVLAARIGRQVSLQDLCEAFQHGFPTERAMNERWDAQKCTSEEPLGADNLLDLPETWAPHVEKILERTKGGSRD